MPGSLGVVGALEAAAIAELSTAAAAGSLAVMAPEPVVTADVRLWAGDDGSLDSATDHLGSEGIATALRESGWRVVGPDGAEAPRSAEVPALGRPARRCRRPTASLRRESYRPWTHVGRTHESEPHHPETAHDQLAGSGVGADRAGHARRGLQLGRRRPVRLRRRRSSGGRLHRGGCGGELGEDRAAHRAGR